MKGECIICREHFVQTDGVSALACGHTFHYPCILQWLEHAKSCPTCRKNATVRSIVRLYFETSDDSVLNQSAEGSTPNGKRRPSEDYGALKNRIATLETELLMERREITKLKEDVDLKKSEIERTKKDVKRSHTRQKQAEDAADTLRNRIGNLEATIQQQQRLEKELKRMKSRLKECEVLDNILHGSSFDADAAIDELSMNGDAVLTSKLLTTVRRQLDETRGKMEKFRDTAKTAEADVRRLNLECDKLSKLVADLREEVKLNQQRPKQTPFNPKLNAVVNDSYDDGSFLLAGQELTERSAKRLFNEHVRRRPALKPKLTRERLRDGAPANTRLRFDDDSDDNDVELAQAPAVIEEQGYSDDTLPETDQPSFLVSLPGGMKLSNDSNGGIQLEGGAASHRSAAAPLSSDGLGGHSRPMFPLRNVNRRPPIKPKKRKSAEGTSNGTKRISSFFSTKPPHSSASQPVVGSQGGSVLRENRSATDVVDLTDSTEIADTSDVDMFDGFR